MKLSNLKKSLGVSLLLLTTAQLHAQIVSYDFYSFRLDNMYNANAAYTGKKEGVNVFLNAQSQNSGVNFANKNISGGLYSRISDKQAIGGRINSDVRGAFQVLKADLTYAYLLKINNDQQLNFGVNAGVLNTNLNTSRIQNFDRLDVTDEMLYSTYFNTVQFTAGAGFLYTFKDLEVSVSAPNLVSTNENIVSYLNAAAFYKFTLNDNFSLTPWISYQNVPITKNVGSLFLKSTYQEKLWVQVGYQTNNAFNAMFGVNIEQFSLGYGFRFSNKTFNTISTGSHEVCMKYQILKGSSSNTGSNSLGNIIKELNQLIETPVTEDNKQDLLTQLDELKKELLKAEIDNSNPQKAKKVESQLLQIDEKLTILEQKFK